jgi:hypothetical protein
MEAAEGSRGVLRLRCLEATSSRPEEPCSCRVRLRVLDLGTAVREATEEPEVPVQAQQAARGWISLRPGLVLEAFLSEEPVERAELQTGLEAERVEAAEAAEAVPARTVPEAPEETGAQRAERQAAQVQHRPTRRPTAELVVVAVAVAGTAEAEAARAATEPTAQAA